MPKAMHIEAACHADDGHILPRLDVADNLKEGDNAWSDFVAACGHHPFFEVVGIFDRMEVNQKVPARPRPGRRQVAMRAAD